MFVRVRRTREHRHRKTEMGVRAARDSFILMHLLRSFFSPLPFRPRTYAHTFFRRDANTFTRRFKKGYKLSCVVSSETTDKKSSPPKTKVSSNEPPKSDFQSHVSLGFFWCLSFQVFPLRRSFFFLSKKKKSDQKHIGVVKVVGACEEQEAVQCVAEYSRERERRRRRRRRRRRSERKRREISSSSSSSSSWQSYLSSPRG